MQPDPARADVQTLWCVDRYDLTRAGERQRPAVKLRWCLRGPLDLESCLEQAFTVLIDHVKTAGWRAGGCCVWDAAQVKTYVARFDDQGRP